MQHRTSSIWGTTIDAMIMTACLFLQASPQKLVLTSSSLWVRNWLNILMGSLSWVPCGVVVVLGKALCENHCHVLWQATWVGWFPACHVYADIDILMLLIGPCHIRPVHCLASLQICFIHPEEQVHEFKCRSTIVPDRVIFLQLWADELFCKASHQIRPTDNLHALCNIHSSMSSYLKRTS